MKMTKNLCILTLGILLLGTAFFRVGAEAAQRVLFAYVGAGLKDPVTEVAALYEKKTGVRTEMSLNNSAALFSQLKNTQRGDIYMPGAMPFLDPPRQEGYILKTSGPIAFHVPVIVTPKGESGANNRGGRLGEAGNPIGAAR